VDGPAPIGHEYCGVVEEAGADVRTVKPGQVARGYRAMDERRAIKSLLMP
jgi:Zn-dependent alcohol dehydrogenase